MALRGTVGTLLLVVGTSLGCGLIPDEPEPEPMLPIEFAAPEMVTVQKGETLPIIAKAHHVSVDDLKSWNGLTTDKLVPDQVLLVWTSPPGTTPAKPSPRTSVAVTPPPVTAAAPAPAPGAPPGAQPPPVTPVAGGEVAEAPTQQRITIETPAVIGVLGMSTDSDVDLADVASGMEHHDTTNMGSTGLSGRAVMGNGKADDLVLKQRPMTNGGVQIPNTPVTPPHLTKPPPKTCLHGAGMTVSESGKVTSGGLSVGQINAGMAGISRYTVKCFPPGTKGTYAVNVEITAGCNGQVSNVYLVDAGVVPPNVTSCLTKTLAYAGFPAHSLPDGVTFKYPMKFTF